MNIKDKELIIPIIQGGMGVGVSLGNLAGAVAAKEGMGIISTVNAGYREDDFSLKGNQANQRALIKEIEKAREISKGKGLIGINIMVATRNYAETVKTAIAAGIDTIISGAGLPMELPELVRGSEVAIAPIVSSGKAAKVICKAWDRKVGVIPDFIVIEGSEAGGHLGFSNEELVNHTAKTLSEILQEVLVEIKPFEEKYNRSVPVFVAGGIYSGSDMARYIKEGAAGVQIGTRFIATNECDASLAYKEVIINAKKEEIEIVKSPVGMPGRAITTPLIRKLREGQRFPATKCVNCLIPCNPNETPYCISHALIEAAKGNLEEGLYFCGSNAWRINKMYSVSELIDEIIYEMNSVEMNSVEMNSVEMNSEEMNSVEKIAFLYAGQGSQCVGMGKDFYQEFSLAKETFDSVDLGFDLKSLCFEGPMEMLSQTEFTQPCMVTFAIAITKLLKENRIEPHMVAGLSLGEYSALYCAGVLGEDDVKKIARFRGQSMAKAAKGVPSKMVAVLGATKHNVELACQKGQIAGIVEIANLNCPGQIVIGGEVEAVDQAIEEVLKLGAKRCLPLNVSGPFHTSLMEPASIELEKKFETTTFSDMNIPVIFNASGSILNKDETVSNMLVRQVKESVHFEETIQYLVDSGITTIIEIGPGKVLSGFVKKINRDMKLYQIDSVESFNAVVEKIITS